MADTLAAEADAAPDDDACQDADGLAGAEDAADLENAAEPSPDEVFRRIDLGHMGFLTRNDLTIALRAVDETAWTDEAIVELLSEVDPDGVDSIERSTFIRWACKCSDCKARLFATMASAPARRGSPPPGFLRELPLELPGGEPYYYLSRKQWGICSRLEPLAPYAAFLPGWVPHRRVADALSLPHKGIDNAMRKLGGTPYVWGTEFENVHTLWHFEEPSITVNGCTYKGSENYYQRQKPNPFDEEMWMAQRDEVMRTAVREKFAEPQLRRLLVSTHPHPLLSIKGDRYWGVEPSGQGENQLAVLLMELRDSLVEAET